SAVVGRCDETVPRADLSVRDNSLSFGDKPSPRASNADGAAPVFRRRDARPALERPIERTLLDETEQIGDFGSRDVALGQVGLRRAIPHRFEQVVEYRAVILEAPLERAGAHGHLLSRSIPGWDRRPGAPLRSHPAPARRCRRDAAAGP